MKKEIVVGICGLAIVIVIIIALFSSQGLRDARENTLREIRTFDAHKQIGFINQGFYPCPRSNILPAHFPGAPPIMQDQALPQLIKELGVEVIPISGGKVKIAGVMGNSWADKAGLKRGDIILRFNKESINGLEHFTRLIRGARPERNYRIKILRDGRVKSSLVTVGEGEMEGFSPITAVTFMQPAGHNPLWSAFYQCPRCGNCLMAGSNGLFDGLCPACRFLMRRIR